MLTEDLRARQIAATGRGVGLIHQAFIDRASNAEVWDVDGRRYVDFAAGIAVLVAGHRDPRIVAAVEQQLGRFHHSCYHVFGYEPYVALAERLNALVPIEGPAKTNFFTTGAEAVENAVKIARAATGRNAVIAFSGSFHGRTLLGMSLTGKMTPYKQQFGAMVPAVHHVPFPLAHTGVDLADSLRAIDHLFSSEVSPQSVAAIIIEPVQGEGGFHVAPPELLNALRGLCDRHGIVMIVDEIQTGFGRTGKMFAIEHAGCSPDLMTFAKALAGGFPLSAVVGRAELMDAVNPGGLGGTYAGFPLACASALSVLDVIEQDALVDRAIVIGEQIKARLQTYAQGPGAAPIRSIRGLGAMVAFDLAPDDEEPASAVRRVLSAALGDGLILLSAGLHGETIRLLPALTIEDDILEEGLEILAAALASLQGPSEKAE